MLVKTPEIIQLFKEMVDLLTFQFVPLNRKDKKLKDQVLFKLSQLENIWIGQMKAGIRVTDLEGANNQNFVRMCDCGERVVIEQVGFLLKKEIPMPCCHKSFTALAYSKLPICGVVTEWKQGI